jgi:hypothetical protein
MDELFNKIEKILKDELNEETLINLEQINEELIKQNGIQTQIDKYIAFAKQYDTFTLIIILYIINNKEKKAGKILIDSISRRLDDLVLIFTKLLICYEKYEPYFCVPESSVVVNFIFKFPDIISNYMSSSYIESKVYYHKLFDEFYKRDIFNKYDLVEKCSKLKLNKMIIYTMMNDIGSRISIIDIYRDSVYYDDFLSALFNIKVFHKDEFDKIREIYFHIKDISQIKDEIFNFISKNVDFVSLVLLSHNNELIDTFMNSIADNIIVKFDQYDSFTFYQICYSIYHYIESGNLNFSNSIFIQIGKIIQKVLEPAKKKVFYIFNAYLKEIIAKNIKSDDKEIHESNILTPEDREVLNFINTKQKLIENNLYFNEFEKKFTNLFKIEKNIKMKKFKKETRYISVAYQKKHGVFIKEKLEISQPEDLISIKLKKDDNFLKIKLEKEDDYSDLNPLSTPMYIKDCILGLNSDFADRQKLSLQALPEIISNQPFDLEYNLEDLTEALLKLSNTFEIEEFDTLLENNIIRLIVHFPIKMTQQLCKRFFLEQCGIKQKFQILNSIEKACEEIGSSNNKQNRLHVFYENIIFPLLNYLKSSRLDFLLTLPDFDYLLARFLALIAKLIKFSENHPFIYKSLFESFKLFQAISIKKDKSSVLISSLNYYTSILSKFITDTFVEIYPEFLECVSFIIKFLNELEPESEEQKIQILHNLENYITKLEKLKYSINNISKDLLI